MNILWFSWKDGAHPEAGGAEVVASELSRRLAEEGHNVHFVTSGFKGAPAEAEIATAGRPIKITRVGNRYTVYVRAYQHYKKHLRGWADLVIDEVNTMPFFARHYVAEPSIVLIHQLCEEVWFYQLPRPLGVIGRVTEPFYLRLLRGQQVITVSDSTKQGLMRLGFSPAKIHLISEGISIEPANVITNIKKFAKPTMLSHGSVRPMKRTHLQLAAFEIAKRSIPDLQLKVTGSIDNPYGRKFVELVQKSPYAKDIELAGRVSDDQKKQYMQKSHVFVATSVKEGWGLVVTEAASQGTPAVVFDVDGLRDSVRHNKTGLVVAPSAEALAEGVVALLGDRGHYQKLRRGAWQWSKQITFDQSYKDFKKVSIEV